MVSTTDLERISSISDCQKVWNEYKLSESLELRNKLVEFYLPLVQYNAKSIKAKLPEEIELDDLVSSGVIGLMNAISAFDFSRGVKFETYCVPRIRGAILDELRTMDWVPRLVRSQVSKYQKVMISLRHKNGGGNSYFPSVKDISEHLGISLEDAEKIMLSGSVPIARLCRIVEIPRGEDGEIGIINSNSLADQKSLRPEDKLSKDEGFHELISCLSDEEQIIVTLYHRDNFEMWRIGEIIGLSESRVSQIHSLALQKIKDSLTI